MYIINCLIEGDAVSFEVKIDGSQTVSYLKKEINKEKSVAPTTSSSIMSISNAMNLITSRKLRTYSRD